MSFLALRNAQAVPVEEVPRSGWDELREAITRELSSGRRLSCLCAEADGTIWAVLADDGEGRVMLARSRIEGERFPALTATAPAAHWFEREIAEQYGFQPEDHPWLKPLRFHRSWRAGADAWDRREDEAIQPGVCPMYRVEGDEVHEVAVGPVHAGVIEPGHFRFQCHGEQVFHLEIVLGYQHRGAEQALQGGPDRSSLARIETVAGDTSIGHAWAWCQAIEALSGCVPSPRAQRIRALALELERLANHVGDLGALANDVGFLPTASFNGRIRGDWLNLSAQLCGSRLGRGLLLPGGVRFDCEPERSAGMTRRLERLVRDTTGSCELLLATPSVQARFEGVGVVRSRDAVEAGLVGVARRASGLAVDVRRNLPFGPYGELGVFPAVAEGGDVLARAQVRWTEIQRSCELVGRLLPDLGPGPLRQPVAGLRPGLVVASLVEGWRGEICHLLVTGADARLRRVKLVDPSFHNWFGLMLALRDEQISDFPLCNKSFNLSYCGADL